MYERIHLSGGRPVVMAMHRDAQGARDDLSGCSLVESLLHERRLRASGSRNGGEPAGTPRLPLRGRLVRFCGMLRPVIIGLIGDLEGDRDWAVSVLRRLGERGDVNVACQLGDLRFGMGPDPEG